jgi:valyl-tRNA synthetase
MLGDTAVAVHPEDEKHSVYIGGMILLPLTTRKIPVIADVMVDREFGTGAVKITPAHDFNDFEVGKRHRLDRISIFDERAHVKAGIEDIDSDVMEKISGLHAHKAREKVIHILKEKGFLAKSEDYNHAIGRCYRCKTVIEPYLSPQWFVRTESLAKEPIRAVEEGRTSFIPKGWENTYFEWMRNIKDWCISRQIWWGHQIPAWYCIKCNREEIFEIHGERRFAAKARPIVSRTEPEACPSCGGSDIVRDNDVLDTWFSSALWPFTTLGWPERTKELSRYYPTSVLVTGFDIIFFWVARMMMMGLKFMNDVPFHEVYIHPLIRDAEGQKMSKSKGNVIDPLIIMDKYGTDAFRFTLTAMASQGRDIKLAEERIEGYRNFCNKIWNLARFTLMNLNGFNSQLTINESQLTLADKWILMRLKCAIEAVRKGMEGYRFNDVANAVYQFIWHELCDWYVEFVKSDLKGDNGEERRSTAQVVLLKVLRDSIKLLHPIMPFITEEIWDVIPRERAEESESVTVATFPTPVEDVFSEAEADMNVVMDVIKAVRNIRSGMNIQPSSSIQLICQTDNERLKSLLAGASGYLTPLARLSEFVVSSHAERPADSASAVVGEIELYVPLKGLVDFAEEEKRLVKDIGRLSKEFDGLKRRLSNEEFLNKAPEEIVSENRERLNGIMEKKKKLGEALERIRDN